MDHAIEGMVMKLGRYSSFQVSWKHTWLVTAAVCFVLKKSPGMTAAQHKSALLWSLHDGAEATAVQLCPISLGSVLPYSRVQYSKVHSPLPWLGLIFFVLFLAEIFLLYSLGRRKTAFTQRMLIWGEPFQILPSAQPYPTRWSTSAGGISHFYALCSVLGKIQLFKIHPWLTAIV